MRSYQRNNQYGTYSIKSLRTNSKDKSQNLPSHNNNHFYTRKTPLNVQISKKIRNQYFADCQNSRVIKNGRQQRSPSLSLRGNSAKINNNRNSQVTTANYKGGRFNEKVVNQLNLQIEKLQKQIQKRDRIISSLKSKNLLSKQYQSQLVEAYRVLHYYQGKISSLQRNTQIYQQSQPYLNAMSSLGEYFQESYIKIKQQNQQLSSQLSKRIHDFQFMEDKYRKSQARSMSLYKKMKYSQISKRRSQATQSQKNLTSESYYLDKNKSLQIREQILNQFYQKIKTLEDNINQLHQQHQKVTKQLSQKLEDIKQLTIKNQALQQQIKVLKMTSKNIEHQKQNRITFGQQKNSSIQVQYNNPLRFSKVKNSDKISSQKSLDDSKSLKSRQSELQKVVVLPKNILNQIKNPYSLKQIQIKQFEKEKSQKSQKVGTQIQLLGQFQDQSQKKEDLISKRKISQISIKDDLIRKLRFKAMRSNFQYKQFLSLLITYSKKSNLSEGNQFLFSEQSSIIKSLQQSPFYLTFEEAKQIQDAIESFSGQNIRLALSQIISPYHNISLMQDLSMVSQISNAFRNREQEVEEIIKQNTYKIKHQIVNDIMTDWGLNKKQIDFVGLKAYQLSQQVEYIDFQLISDYFLRN